MKQVIDLQKLISDRAEKKLDKELCDFCETLHSGIGVALFDVGQNVQVIIDGKTETLRTALWSSKNTLFELVKQKLLADRIGSESNAFLKKVESLEQDVLNLLAEAED